MFLLRLAKLHPLCHREAFPTTIGVSIRAVYPMAILLHFQLQALQCHDWWQGCLLGLFPLSQAVILAALRDIDISSFHSFGSRPPHLQQPTQSREMFAPSSHVSALFQGQLPTVITNTCHSRDLGPQLLLTTMLGMALIWRMGLEIATKENGTRHKHPQLVCLFDLREDHFDGPTLH